MSCHCHQNPCCCFSVTLPDNPVQALTFENQNLAGIGVFDNQTGSVVGFKGVTSATVALTVTNDAVNHTIVLTLDIPSIIDDLPTATTVQRGVGETATDGEAIAKAAADKFLTPSNLAALGSTLTFAGLVELATAAETQAGVIATMAVTPAGLASVIALQQGTEVWADAVARAAADPDFAGQAGVQLDTDVLYISTGAAVGDFDMPVFMLDNLLNQLSTNTTLDMNGQTMTFTGGAVFFDGGLVNFNNGSVKFGDSASEDFDFGISVNLMIANAQVPAASVLVTAAAGVPSSRLLNTILSTGNTDTGWTNFTNSAVRKTGDCNTITLPQLAQVVDTLIQTLGTAVDIPVP